MYRTLLKGLPDGHRVVFVYPDDIAHRLSASKYSLNEQTRQDLLGFVGLSKETNELIGLMRDSQKALEQETYLMSTTTRDWDRLQECKRQSGIDSCWISVL